MEKSSMYGEHTLHSTTGGVAGLEGGQRMPLTWQMQGLNMPRRTSPSFPLLDYLLRTRIVQYLPAMLFKTGYSSTSPPLLLLLYSLVLVYPFNPSLHLLYPSIIHHLFSIPSIGSSRVSCFVWLSRCNYPQHNTSRVHTLSLSSRFFKTLFLSMVDRS